MDMEAGVALNQATPEEGLEVPSCGPTPAFTLAACAKSTSAVHFKSIAFAWVVAGHYRKHKSLADLGCG